MWAALAHELTHEIQYHWGGNILEFHRTVSVFFQRFRALSLDDDVKFDEHQENRSVIQVKLAGTSNIATVSKDDALSVLGQKWHVPPDDMELVYEGRTEEWVLYPKESRPNVVREDFLWKDVIEYAEEEEQRHLRIRKEAHGSDKALEVCVILKDQVNDPVLLFTHACSMCTLSHVFWRLYLENPELIHYTDILTTLEPTPHHQPLTHMGKFRQEDVDSLGLVVFTEESRTEPFRFERDLMPPEDLYKHSTIVRMFLGDHREVTRVRDIKENDVRFFANMIRDALESS